MQRRAIAAGGTVLVATLLFSLVFLFAPPQVTSPVPQSAQPLKNDTDMAPLVTLPGSNSEIAEPLFVRCDNAGDWESLWQKHAPSVESPKVNFKKCTALGIFLGKKFNSRGVFVVSTESKDGHCVLRFDEHTFQTAGGSSPCKPFGIILLPKTNQPIVIEENVQNIKDSPQKWKERARLK